MSEDDEKRLAAELDRLHQSHTSFDEVVARALRAESLLSERTAEVERVRDYWNERCCEVQMNGFQWMRAHDKLLGFIQDRPEALRDLLANDPRGKMPSPADVPEAIARAEQAETSLAAALKRASELEPKLAASIGYLGATADALQRLDPGERMGSVEMIQSWVRNVRAALTAKEGANG